MRYIKLLALVSLVFLFIQTGFSQTPADDLLKKALAPSEQDMQAAKQENAQVFRIFRRGTRDELSVRGGGAYYSFFSKDHSYNKTPQIGFELDKLLVAFYGANGGFIADLGQVPLSSINKDSESINFLAAYKPPVAVSEARFEFQKSQKGFTAGGTAYRSRAVAVEGNTYALRAISYGEADTLVAFKIYRKDADGSLIIFWKLLKGFETPVLARDQ
jgi:hypothetical protein